MQMLYDESLTDSLVASTIDKPCEVLLNIVLYLRSIVRHLWILFQAGKNLDDPITLVLCCYVHLTRLNRKVVAEHLQCEQG